MPILSNFPAGAKQNDASSTVAGIAKLYSETGANTDGAMTQAAVTDALSGKSDTGHTHTASDVGADASGSAAQALADAKSYADAAVSTHDASTSAHQDIRDAIPTATSELENDSGFVGSEEFEEIGAEEMEIINVNGGEAGQVLAKTTDGAAFVSLITYGTEDLTAGTSALASGTLYVVYE